MNLLFKGQCWTRSLPVALRIRKINPRPRDKAYRISAIIGSGVAKSSAGLAAPGEGGVSCHRVHSRAVGRYHQQSEVHTYLGTW